MNIVLATSKFQGTSGVPEQQEEWEERQAEKLEHEFHDESESGHGYPVQPIAFQVSVAVLPNTPEPTSSKGRTRCGRIFS